jgi:hypothetical protein
LAGYVTFLAQDFHQAVPQYPFYAASFTPSGLIEAARTTILETRQQFLNENSTSISSATTKKQKTNKT